MGHASDDARISAVKSLSVIRARSNPALNVGAWDEIVEDVNCAAEVGMVQETDSEFAALNAAQVLEATTATALPRGTTAITPAGVAGVRARVPPIVGQFLTDA
jgi:hypothetical protein